MMDDPSDLARRAAYIDAVRALGRELQTVGYGACLIGVMMVAYAAAKLGGPLSLVGIGGLAVVAVGWVLFVYVIMARARYVRRNPYKPQD